MHGTSNLLADKHKHTPTLLDFDVQQPVTYFLGVKYSCILF